MDRFDVCVIGSGPGGYIAAIRAAQLGLKTAIVEKDATLGGTCLNVGCIPSKAMLESSELYHQAAHKFAGHGIKTEGLSFDLAAMLERKRGVVKDLTDGVRMLMQKNKITVFAGVGSFVSPTRIRVAGEKESEIEATHTIIATGSVPIELPFLKYDHKVVVDSTDALSFAKVPKSLVVIGGGAIGLEMGSVWARLGAKVTVVELLDRICPFADKQVTNALQKSLEALGMTFLLKHRVTGAEVGKTKATVKVATPEEKELELAAEKVLVAVGRRAYTDGLNLAAAGLTAGKGGKLTVDQGYRTSVPNIYAIGDVIYGPMLAHKAEDEGVACAENIAGKHGHVNYRAIPNIVYTWPELATVGMSEDELKEEGIAYKSGRFLFKVNARAKTMAETDGFVKVLADAKTDRLLGVSIVGPRASDLIAEAVTVMEFGGSAEDMARTCHAHPTLGEAVKEAALAVDRRTLNS